MIKKMQEYVELGKKKAEIDAELKLVKEAMSELEPQIMEYMTQNSMQKITIQDRTLYIRKQFRASYKGTEESGILAAVFGLGDAFTTTIHPQRAAAIVRERLEEAAIADREEQERKQLEKVFTIYEDFRVGMTR